MQMATHRLHTISLSVVIYCNSEIIHASGVSARQCGTCVDRYSVLL